MISFSPPSLHTGIKYKNIPKDRAPFDFAQSKKTFVREVVNFRPAYGRQANHGEESIAFDVSVGKDGISQIDTASMFSQVDIDTTLRIILYLLIIQSLTYHINKSYYHILLTNILY